MASTGTNLSTDAGMSPAAFLGAGITLVAVCAAFVLMRVVGNLRRDGNHYDDYAAVIALLLTAATVALTHVMVEALVSPTTTIASLLQISQITNWITALTMLGAKVPIIILYIKIFGVITWLRVTAYTTLVVMVVSFVTGAAVVSGTCDAHGGPTTAQFLMKCSEAASNSGVALGIMSVLVDAAIFVMPLPVIIGMKLPRHKKVGLAIVFATGVFAIIASIISTTFKWESKQGTSMGMTNAMICTLVECTISIIVGCAPACYSFWTQTVVKASLYSKAISIFSRSSIPLHGAAEWSYESPKRSQSAREWHHSGDSKDNLTNKGDIVIQMGTR